MNILEVNFDINLSTLLALLTGILCGVILTILIGTLLTLINIKKDTIIIENYNNNITIEEINHDINKVKDSFKLKMKEDKQVDFNFIININLQLIKQIASRFYPKSKDPISELTFEELSLLIDYIHKKLNKLMNKGPLSIAKKIKLSWVLKIINAKSKIDSTPVIKTAKKYKLSKITNAISTTLQFLNPAMWLKKLVYDPCVNMIIKKIILIIIDTIGQETYHIYSKQAFLDPVKENELQEFISNFEKINAIESKN
jgi:hypothetical protein